MVGVRRTTAQVRCNETLTLVENLAGEFQWDGASVFKLQSQEGFKEVAELINSGRLDVRGYKFIVLLFGRADLWELDKYFKQNLASCLNAIKNKNSKALLVLTTTLPQPNDSGAVIKTAGYRNRYMSQLAAEAPRLEFSRPGKHLLQLGTCNLDCFDPFGNLTEKGLDLIRRGLEAKFHCAKLNQKFEELKSREDV